MNEKNRGRRKGLGARAVRVSGIALAIALAAAGAQAAYNRIQVPIRWCIVTGSPAVSNPGCSCQPNAPFVPIARGARASYSYRNASMLFRGAGMPMGPGFAFPNVRYIADPCDPAGNPSCPGASGDIFIDMATNNFTEYFQVVNACRQAWNQTGIGAPGLIGVNIRQFVDAAGAPAPAYGLGGTPVFNNAYSQAAAGQFAVMDDDFFLDYTNLPLYGNVTANPDMNVCMGNTIHPSSGPCVPEILNDGLDVLTAHENGHALSLGHTPMTAMAAALPSAVLYPTLTAGGPGMNDLVCPAQPLPQPTSQSGQVRLQSICHQNGTIVDPPPVVDEQPLTIGDAWPGWIDLELVGLVKDGNTGTAGFFWRSLDAFPANATGLVYQFALDLDQDPLTGGDPTTVGISVPQAGVELAGSVTVDVVSGTTSTADALWRWDELGMAFVPEPTLGSGAENGELWVDDFASGASAPLAAHSLVRLRFDGNLLSGGSTTHSMGCRAADPMLAGEDLALGAELYMEPPGLSVCEVLPGNALPGELVTVSASGLLGDQPTRVWLDMGPVPAEVTTGLTDPLGNTSSDFVVPPSAEPGAHTVRILVDKPDQEISSVCTLNVLPINGPPGETAAADPLVVTDYDRVADEMTIGFGPSCEAEDHALYFGSLSQGSLAAYAYDRVQCDLGTGGTATVPFTSAGDRFFLLVGQNGVREGSYGRDGQGAERPAGDLVSTCNLPQELAATCSP